MIKKKNGRCMRPTVPAPFTDASLVHYGLACGGAIFACGQQLSGRPLKKGN
jgi:hypothetical protein